MRDRRTWPQRLLLLFNVGVIAVALLAAWVLSVSLEKTSSVNRVQLAGALTPADPVTPGSRVINILLVGSDSSAGLDPDDPISQGRIGERNGDVIIIAHLDERDGTAALLSVPRDLWVPIAGTDRERKINSAFATGGAATLIETIESEFDIPINYFVNVDFAGFEGLVDAVGSVDVFFDRPARDWNPSEQRTQTGFEMLSAGCQSLDPPTALAYVRSRFYQTMDEDGRWVTDPTSDLGRIRRQQDFLQSLMQRAIDTGARNPFVLSNLIDASLRNVSIDQELTPNLLIDLGRTFASFEPGELETYSFPARSDVVGSQEVLLPLDAEAAPIVALFQGAPSNDPSTVRVTVVHAQQADPAPTLEALERAGFEVEGPRPSPVDPGIVVRYGVDGSQAGQLVAAALGDDVRLEEVSGLLGRDVRVVIGPSAPENSPAENSAAENSPAENSAGESGTTSAPTATTSPESAQSPVTSSDLTTVPLTTGADLPTEDHAGCG